MELGMEPGTRRKRNSPVAALRYLNEKDVRIVNAVSLKHMKYIRLMMLSVGIWPEDAIRGRPRRTPYYTYYRVVETCTLIVGQTFWLINKFNDSSFFVLGNVYITLVLSFVDLGRAILACASKYGDIFKTFLTQFHLCHFTHKDEHAYDIFLKMNRLSTLFTVFTVTLSTSGVITFNLAPLYASYRAGLFREVQPENMTLEFSIAFMFPGFKQDDYFFITFILNLWFSYVSAIVITVMDLFLVLIVFQIIGHIRYLRITLKNFPQPRKLTFYTEVSSSENTRLNTQGHIVDTVTNFNDQENEIIRLKIIECVKHHIFVLNFTADISKFFGSLVALNYLYHLFTLSLLLVESQQGRDGCIHYGPLTLMTLAQLSQLSIIFEIVHSESEKLRDDVYCIPWESMSVSNQKSVGFMLRRMQTPIAVRALGMTAVGVRTMGSILKTTCSYCAFLRSSNP